MPFTLQEIDRMTAEEYKQHLSDPEFVKVINESAAVPANRASAPTGTSSARDRAQLTERRTADPVAFDPSFDNQPALPVLSAQPEPAVEAAPADAAPVAAVAPVVEPPPAAPELKKFEVSYQPMDEAGRPVGGRQVIKYEADSEIPESHPLVQQLIKNHIAATVSLKEARKQNILNSKEVPEGATVFPALKSLKVYTPEYRQSLEEQLQDPAKADQAAQHLEQDDMRRQQNQLQEDNFNTQTLLALEQFKNDNPDYFKCQENGDSIVAWVRSRDLDPREKNNFQRAYNALKDIGAIVTRPSSTQPPVTELSPATPSVREVETRVNTQPVQVPPARIGQEAPAQVPRPVALIPTGLTRQDVSEGEPMAPNLADQLTLVQELKDSQGRSTGEKKTFKGLDAIDRMSATEYARRVKEDEKFHTGFQKLVNTLEATRKVTYGR